MAAVRACKAALERATGPYSARAPVAERRAAVGQEGGDKEKLIESIVRKLDFW